MLMVRRTVLKYVPDELELKNIDLSVPNFYRLHDKEMQRLRRRIYGWNRNNEWWRYSTRRQGNILMVWRMEKL